jgi:hypothetical protein
LNLNWAMLPAAQALQLHTPVVGQSSQSL